jgi:hypothetical protein
LGAPEQFGMPDVLIQIPLMWYPCSVHKRIMHCSLGLPTLRKKK